MIMPGPDTYFFGSDCTRFTESSHQENSFRDKKNYEKLDSYVIFLKQKLRSASKKIVVSPTSLDC